MITDVDRSDMATELLSPAEVLALQHEGRQLAARVRRDEPVPPFVPGTDRPETLAYLAAVRRVADYGGP
jgi:hypothetical protein